MTISYTSQLASPICCVVISFQNPTKNKELFLQNELYEDS